MHIDGNDGLCLWVQCVQVARIVLEDEWIAAHTEAGRWRHRHLWLARSTAGRFEARKRGNKSQHAQEHHAPSSSSASHKDIEMGNA
jgi:hypothetical protein